jgi:cytochrome c biogenesis protein CcmG, thiol:disulfide interchange protein DsbE
MPSAAQSLLDNARLRRTGLAVLLGVAILGSVYLVERGNSQRTTMEIISAPAVAGLPAPRIGEPAPDFQVPGPDGQMISLSQFKGRPIWINFWASWCAPCRAEFPEMDAVYKRHQSDGLVLLAVSFAERPDEVVSYLEKARPSFTIGIDQPGTVAGQYRVLGLPTHLFIDAEGIVREVRVGPMNEALMEEKLAGILPRR